MAAGNAAQGQPPATRGPVSLDRLHRVRGAGGIIAARGRQQGRDSDLVSANQKDQELSQNQSLAVNRRAIPAISCSSSVNEAEYAAGSARITRSTPRIPAGARILVRTSSRSLRFNLFLSTDVLPCFGTTSPDLAKLNGEAVARTSRCSVRHRLPVCLTR